MVKTSNKTPEVSDFFAEKTVFITGASGFIGSWLIKSLLDKGAEPVCLIRDSIPGSMFFSENLDRKVKVARGELESYSAVERTINEYSPEIVIHLGAQTLVGTANKSPIGTLESNIKGTWNVLEACRMHDKTIKSIVIASSDKAYGEQATLPYTEESPLNATNPYDASKACADILSNSYAKTYNLPLSISRCGNFFGGGDMNFSRLVPGTLRSLFRDERPVLRSDGSYVRDYIYVLDAVNTYEVLAQKTEEKKFHGDAFNFSNEIQMTALELTNLIIKKMNANLKPILKNEAKGEITKQHLSSKKARELLGWKHQWGIDAGLDETIAWYRKYFSQRIR